MSTEERRPKVGVGLMIIRDGQVLLTKRKNAHGAGEYASPGGHLEFGESIFECALRELAEECGSVEVANMRFQFISNVTAYPGKHYLHVGVTVDWVKGEAENLEPGKSEGWEWYPINQLPQPMFVMAQQAVDAYHSGEVFFDSK
jgi:8-oxo-dGTP diphosphatase